MPTDNSVTVDFSLLSHFATLLIFIFYAIFALIMVRQVDLMSQTLITPVSPVVKALSIIHAGVAVGLIVLALGVF